MSRERDPKREIAPDIEKGAYNYGYGVGRHEENENEVALDENTNAYNEYVECSSQPMDFQYDPDAFNYFIKFVLVIVLIMTIATAVLIILVMATPEVKLIFKQNGLIITVLAIVFLIIADSAISFWPSSREAPYIAVVLVLTVLGMSLIGARISAYFNTGIILYYVMTTIGIFFVCMVSACNSFDYLSFQTYVTTIFTTIFINVAIFLLTQITGYPMKLLVMGILFISTMLQAIMIANQIQNILSGKSIVMSVNDYDIASFLLYTSILDISVRIIHLYATKTQNSGAEEDDTKTKPIFK